MEHQDHRPRVAAERRERMRSRLIEGAMTLVAKHGPEATSIDQVITEAQVSRGTFYKYFDAPASLVGAVAKEVAHELLLLIDPVVQLSPDPIVRMATGMRLLLRLCSQHPVLGGFLIRLGWPNMPPVQVMLEFVPRDLEMGMQQGKFLRVDRRVALNLTIGTALGGIHAILSGTTPPDYPEQAATAILMGLGVEPNLAHEVGYGELTPLTIDGDGLLARTLSKIIN